MTSCAELDALITPFVDGEVAGDVCQAIRTHLEGCPACRERVAMEQSARTLIREWREALRGQAPATLAARCRATAAVAAPQAGRRWLMAAAAGVVIATVIAGGMWFTSRLATAFAAQLVIDHLKCFELADRSPGTLDPRAAEERWRGQYGWALKVPASTTDLRLVDVRRCVHTEGPMAHLLYRRAGRSVSLFVIPGTTRRERHVEVMGYEAVIWSSGGRTYVVLGRDDAAAWTQVVAYLRSAVD